MGLNIGGFLKNAVGFAPYAQRAMLEQRQRDDADKQRSLAQLYAQNSDRRAELASQLAQQQGAASIGRLNAETTKLSAPIPPKQTYDPSRGVMVNETDSTFTPIAGLPNKPVPPKAPGNIDPLSDQGITASATRAGKVAAAEAPYKKDPNAPAAPKPPNEFANKAALLYQRAADAAQRLDPYYDKGASPKSTASHIPIVGNYLLSPDEQTMNQAAETVASAILRLESGAAISESEVRSYAKQFLPQPGDSPAVRADKRSTLKAQLERIRIAAQPAMANAPAPATAPAAGASGRGRGGPPSGNINLQQSPHVQTIDEMIKAGKTDAEIRAALAGRP